MRTLFLMLALTLNLPGTRVRAQVADCEAIALQAYLTGDLDRWDEALAATRNLTDPATRLRLRAEYALAAAYVAVGKEDEDARDRYMKVVDDDLDEFWDIDERDALAHALYAALLGLKIARKPITGALHGGRASNYAERALKLDSEHPTVRYHAAGNLYYTPEMWGGDPELALEYLTRAAAGYGDNRNENFRYLASLAFLGQAQARLDQPDAARATYRTALSAQPNFFYVREVLLPQLDGQ